MTYRQRYKDKTEQLFYMNCCDCLRYGYGFSCVPSCGEDEAKREIIWKQAVKDMERMV